jgi:hypothetical protein
MTDSHFRMDSVVAMMAGANGQGDIQIGLISKRLDRLCQRLKKYSFSEIARKVGGLLTVPDNHPASLRLETLIHLAALNSRGKSVPTPAHIREWINDFLFRDPITHMEDPVEDVFVSNVPTWHGNVRLFNGFWPDSDYHLRTCLAALLSFENRPWFERTRRHVEALLKISEAIAERGALRDSRFQMVDLGSRYASSRLSLTHRRNACHLVRPKFWH